MFKKFTIILIVILFIWNICLTMKKNKEKFAQSISQQNLQAIKNLGALASQLTSNGNTLLTIDDLQIKVGGTPTKLSDWIVSKNSAIQGKLNSIDSAIKTNLTNSNSTLKTAIADNLTKSNSTLQTAIKRNLTDSDSTLKVLENNFNYFKKLMRNHTHEYSYGGSGGSRGIIIGGGSSSSPPVLKNKKPIVVLNRLVYGGSCYTAAIKLWDEGTGNMYDEFYDKNFAFNNDQNANMIGPSGRVCIIGDDVGSSGYYSSR